MTKRIDRLKDWHDRMTVLERDLLPILPFGGRTLATLETSRDAAASVRQSSIQQRTRVFHAIAFSSHGLTDEELQRQLGLSGDQERPRRWELMQAGLIQPVGKRRTQSGRQAVVWGVK